MQEVQNFLTQIIPLLFAISFHEAAHAWASYKLGDDTAYLQGRITMNPIPHIDPILTVALPLMLYFSGSPVLFGGAKPVPVNMYKFKDPKKGMLLVALAGPISNIILFLASLIIFKSIAGIKVAPDSQTMLILAPILKLIMFSMIINLALALFNMFPILPLDGGRVLHGLLPEPLDDQFETIEPYGILIVFGLLYTGVFDIWMSPIQWVLENVIY